ncbi:MAG: DUF6485 family protein [Myxococcales bacterium]|jgi:hypothetical protein|nr:DUF6485 family protein [Myxococcales bacterium]
MDCPRKEDNLARCKCSYPGCGAKGTCCACLHRHLKNRQLPACCFSSDVEKTFDRSFERFAELVQAEKI